MPNESVFNQSSQPLYIRQVNTYAAPGIDSWPEGGAAKAGLLYGISYAATVTAAAPLVLQAANPANSGRTMYISRVTGSSASASTLSLLRGGVVTGTAITPVNFNFGSASASNMTVRGSATVPTGSPSTLISLLLAAGPAIVEFAGQIVVPPGSSLTATLTVGTGSSGGTAGISWWEY